LYVGLQTFYAIPRTVGRVHTDIQFAHTSAALHALKLFYWCLESSEQINRSSNWK